MPPVRWDMARIRPWLLASVLLSLGLLAGCGEDSGSGVDESRVIDPLALADALDGDVTEDPGLFVNEGWYPESAREDQIKALERANWYRWQSGLAPLDEIEAINQAAQAHCDYYVLHFSQYQSSGLSPHNEDPSWAEGFSGEAPWDRTAKFGYSQGVSEVIAFVRNPVESVDGWMNTLYHRIPFMDGSLMAMGYGAAGSGAWSNSTRIDTVDFGTLDHEGKGYAGSDVAGIYPPPGSSGIPVSFDGLESPQPPPPPTGYPSGTIVSITWSSSAPAKVTEHSIWAEEDQVPLEHVWLDASNDSTLQGAATVALYPYAPLKEGKKYWVEMKGEKGGKPWELKWYFYTVRY